MYLVRRGPQKGSIDRALEKQAKSAGVKIVYNSRLNKDKADIIATGIRKPTVAVTGALFRTAEPDKEARHLRKYWE
jgi:hypothetical protein